MKALYLLGPRAFAWREAQPPDTPPGWVRVRMRHVGICGSDLHYFVAGRIGDQVVTSPFILGHEGSGEVLDGAGRFPAGLPVYLEPAISCHRCDQCLAGRENTCRKLKFLGNPLELDGCMREEISMPAECIVPVPDWMDLEESVLLEPLCIGAYAVDRSRISGGSSAAIVGAGPIGLSVQIALSDLAPCRAFVSEPVRERRLAAERLGAERTFDPGSAGSAGAVFDAAEGGVDVAFECAGTQEAVDDASRMLKPGGTLVLIGIPEGLDRLTYDPHLMRRREITVVNIRRQNRMVERAICILQRRRDAARVVITHRIPAQQAARAFEMVERKEDGVIKAMLQF
ncbi:MAG: alcohol dehydrogenase catalytic domain-containing protein [Rubrivivax sp.]|nr:alcohol dehydrogenase catalytic domain-containing protein [Rubrivivax sp.]